MSLSLLSILVVSYTYLAAGVFVIGGIFMLLRWIFKRKGPSNTYLGYPYLSTYPGQVSGGRALKNILGRIFLFTSAKDDPFIRYTSLAFHWSLWIVIAAHADIIAFKFFIAAGIPESTLAALGAYLGTTLAFVMVITGLILVGRRIVDPYLRRISNASDYFAVLLIVAIGISGILMRFMLSSDFAYNQVNPFLLSIVSFAPINVPSAAIYVIHFLFTVTLFLYFPLSKLFHPFSFFTNPTMYSTFHRGEVK